MDSLEGNLRALKRFKMLWSNLGNKKDRKLYGIKLVFVDFFKLNYGRFHSVFELNTV